MTMPDDPFAGRSDLPTEYPSNHAEDRPPRRRSRRRLQVRVGLCALLLVLIAVVPHHHERSRTLPAGMWGRTIACLERDQIEKVTDVRTGTSPDASTRSVVLSRARGSSALAEFIDTGSASAARTLVHHAALNAIDTGAAQSTGSVVWSYALDGDPPRDAANAGDRTLIDFCLTTPDRRSG